MPRDEANLPMNVRRLAGMHLTTMETLAEYVGVSRQAMQAIVAYYTDSRSRPRTATTLKLAEAFGISLDALYQEPVACLREAVDSFEQAPLRLFRAEQTRENLERVKAKPVQDEIPKES
jgi:DNA-binding XRE family transcriptional regulator